MRLLCFKSSLLLFFLLVFKSFAFDMAAYYKKNVPEELLKLYDYVIVNAEDITPGILKNYNKKLVAYISIEEADKGSKISYKKDWIIGKNRNWDSSVLDLRKKDYQEFLLKKIKNLRKKEVKSFFFDTLDSYQLVLKDKDWQSYEKALADFIIKVKKTYPDCKIFLNRGFEVFDRVYKYIDGVIVESLFRGYDGKKYYEVSNEDRKWLIDKLNYIKSKNIPVIVIDYVKPNEKKLARKIAKRIGDLGFTPYVTDKDLSTIGVSNIELFPRKVLVIYSSKYDVIYSDAHRLIQMPLEYFGYEADLKTPQQAMKLTHAVDRYAGIVVWLENNLIKDYDKFYKWILKRVKNKNKILFINYFGFPLTDRYLNPLGISILKNKADPFSKNKIVFKDKIVGFEDQVPLNIQSDILLKVKNGKPLLILKNDKNQVFHPIAITNWGGYLLRDYSLVDLRDITGDVKWIVNPFEILKKALRLKPFPSPDFTTENGMRVFFSHVDGDGSVSLSEIYPGKFASAVIRDEVLKKYKIPIGVSFVEAEIMAYGVYPQYSKKAMKIAKSIYALDNVEPASHTLSHPLKWQEISKLEGEDEKLIPEGYNLKVPNYKFDLYREIVGSAKNLSKLCPPGKKVKLIFWSGDCNPPEKALKIAYENNLLNINNGDTYITKDHPFLSLVAPAGIRKGKYYQIFDGAQDENVYTYGFTRDFWRFKKVIETFELTDKPRRLKPIDIYYHFYSGVKLASLNALKEVYNYVLSQDVIPMKVSEYILKALDFYKSIVAKKGDYWIIKTDKNLRTVKVPKNFGYPNLAKSKGVIGFYPYNDQLYISLDGMGDYKLLFTKEKPKQVYIKQSNARVEKVYKNSFKLKGYLPVKVVFGNFKNCKLKTKYRYKRDKNIFLFNKKEIEFKIECK